MSEASINTSEVTSASSRLDSEAVSQASTASKSISTLACNQVFSDKWGTQSGPAGFQRAYHTYLVGLEDSLSTLKQELSDFATALLLTARAHESNEQDVVDAVSLLRSHYEQLVADNTLESVPKPEDTHPAMEGIPVELGGIPQPDTSIPEDMRMPMPGDNTN